MGENNDSFLDKMLLNNIDEEIPIDVNLINTPAKNLPSTKRTSTVSNQENYIENDKKYDETTENRHKKDELKNSFSAQTKESELLQSLKNQISSLKSEITFLRGELKEKDYVVRTLLNMKCKSIDNYTSTSCINCPSAKSPRKNRIEISDTPAENTPKKTIIEPKNAVHRSYNNNNLEKDKSSIDITRTNLEKIQKFNTANNAEKESEKKQKKVEDREEKPETISTKPSDTNADVTNRVFIIGDSIVKHIRGYELSQRVENCKVFVKSFSGAKVRCMEDYIQPTLRETPSHVILHVGTNDVTTKQDPQQIAESVINLAVKIKKTVMYRYLASPPETINT